MYIHCCYYC